MLSLAVPMRAVVVAAGFFALWAWIAQAVERLDLRMAERLPEWTSAPGLMLMGAGAALTVTCLAAFVTIGEGTPAPFDPPRRFVAVGPYRFVRNPMYVGGAFVLAGWALFRHSPSLLILTAVWLAFFHLFVLAYEEPTLRRKFGQDYERYMRLVSRWIP